MGRGLRPQSTAQVPAEEKSETTREFSETPSGANVYAILRRMREAQDADTRRVEKYGARPGG